MMKTIIVFIFIVFFSFILTSCGSKRYDPYFPEVKGLPYYEYGNPHGVGRMKTIYIAEQLLKNLKDTSLKDKKIAVLPFYNLESLEQTTAFGQFMGEQLISELSELGLNIVEIRNNQSIYMARKIGELFLLRSNSIDNKVLRHIEIEELRKIFGQDLVGIVCGTYFNSGKIASKKAETDDSLCYVNTRIIRIPDSMVVSTASAEIAVSDRYASVKNFNDIEPVIIHQKNFD